MFYNESAMDALERLRLIGPEADLERDAPTTPCRLAPGRRDLPIYQAAVRGRRVPILKTLLTTACERDCAYCPFRAGRAFRRVTFRPSEMADLTAALQRRGHIHGVLLSSGLAGGGPATQDRLLTTATLLRRRGFGAYLHLKLMPGAEKDQVLEAMRVADRVSLNLEAPGARRLRALAPHKWFWRELLQPLRWAAEIRRDLDPRAYGRPKWPSLVTQFVVGAADERDRDLLEFSAMLLQEFGLARVYYSPFRPIPDTPLAHRAPADPSRTRRLYQAFFLLRDYGFRVAELPWDARGNLRAGDPKVLWADAHLRDAPVEINTAPRERLLRVPGLGPQRVEALLQARRQTRLREAEQLRALGLPVARMAPYILLDGRRPPHQLPLPAAEDASSSNEGTRISCGRGRAL